MKQIFYLFTASVILISCSNSPKDTAETVQTNPLTLQDLKKDFKFFNLTEFEIDTFTWESRQGKYKELDSLTFYMVWQNGKRKFVGQYTDRDYLFSWQNRDTNFIEFTIITQDENGYCSLLNYLIFDKNGKFIDKFVAASSCGDAGWVFSSHGKFIDKRTYERLDMEYEYKGEDVVNDDMADFEEFIEGDSTLYHIIINDKGKVTQKEIFKKHFREKL